MMKRNSANHLDEMQDQKLLKLEEYGFWVMSFSALATLIRRFRAIGNTSFMGNIIRKATKCQVYMTFIFLQMTFRLFSLWTG